MTYPRSNHFSVLTHIPWGPEGILPQFVAASSKARVSEAEARQVHARPRIRLDEADHLFICNARAEQSNEEILLYSTNHSQPVKKIGSPRQTDDEADLQIIDFGAGYGQIVLLEIFVRQNAKYNRVTALDLEGAVRWSAVGMHTPTTNTAGRSLDGAFQKLIVWKDKILVVPAKSTGQFVCIDPKTGALREPLITKPLEHLQVFGNHKNGLVKTVFLSHAKRYGLAIHPDEGSPEHLVEGSSALYSALQSAYGIDYHLNIYTNHHDTQHRISPEGAITYTDHLVDLAYNEQVNSLFAFRREADSIAVTQVMADSQTHFKPGNTALPGALAHYTDWQVTRNGSVILPLTTEKGLTVVQWSLPGGLI